jgi:hypothetical protein
MVNNLLRVECTVTTVTIKRYGDNIE